MCEEDEDEDDAVGDVAAQAGEIVDGALVETTCLKSAIHLRDTPVASCVGHLGEPNNDAAEYENDQCVNL